MQMARYAKHEALTTAIFVGALCSRDRWHGHAASCDLADPTPMLPCSVYAELVHYTRVHVPRLCHPQHAFRVDGTWSCKLLT